MSRRYILVLLALVLAGCASHRPSNAAGGSKPHTVVKTFHAYRSNGDLAVHVGDVAPGRCWTTSIAAPSANAYRCIAGDEILDPCFAPPRPASPLEVACVADPWSDAEVLQVTGSLPKASTPGAGRARPWALVLGNGVRCVAATGTVPAVRGVNLDFHCRGGRDAAVRSSAGAVASADYGDSRTNTLQQVAVATIWRV